MKYDLNLDRSERYGWKKWHEDRQPTEEEQDRWSLYTIIFSLVMTVLGFTVFL